ncbi:MAG: Nif3-like dinuclear metal center hexameric protein [Dethiobacter sp.]|nr:Nif3-like dinuclear metal center hexameric protein [Dethiobacter sp.]
MPLFAQTLISYLEQFAPRRLAYDWDNVGLLVGSQQATVHKILIALDVDARVLEEALALRADFIVSHHPLIFRPLKALRTDLPAGKLIATALAAGISIFAAHTNLDATAGGVSDTLADCLGVSETEILRVTGSDTLEKIVVFVPEGHEDNVRRAMAAAGAGRIGNYSHCTFQTKGTGTFMPLLGATPFIGEHGKLEEVEELRVETVFPATLRNRVVRALLKAHPYEEVAYDLYPLQNEWHSFGLGRVGLVNACTLTEFAQVVQENLAVRNVRIVGDGSAIVRKVAVCGGSGGDLIQAALFAGADVLVTGDVRYHEAQEAMAVGLAVIDAGHDATEKVIVPVLRDYLLARIRESGETAEVVASTVGTSPWRTL